MDSHHCKLVPPASILWPEGPLTAPSEVKVHGSFTASPDRLIGLLETTEDVSNGNPACLDDTLGTVESANCSTEDRVTCEWHVSYVGDGDGCPVKEITTD